MIGCTFEYVRSTTWLGLVYADPDLGEPLSDWAWSIAFQSAMTLHKSHLKISQDIDVVVYAWTVACGSSPRWLMSSWTAALDESIRLENLCLAAMMKDFPFLLALLQDSGNIDVHECRSLNLIPCILCLFNCASDKSNLYNSDLERANHVCDHSFFVGLCLFANLTPSLGNFTQFGSLLCMWFHNICSLSIWSLLMWKRKGRRSTLPSLNCVEMVRSSLSIWESKLCQTHFADKPKDGSTCKLTLEHLPVSAFSQKVRLTGPRIHPHMVELTLCGALPTAEQERLRTSRRQGTSSFNQGIPSWQHCNTLEVVTHCCHEPRSNEDKTGMFYQLKNSGPACVLSSSPASLPALMASS